MSTRTTERMTAGEFLEKYGHCSGVELVGGRVVWPGREPEPRAEAEMPKFRHGVVCFNAGQLIGGFVKANALGWVATNDTFIPVGANVRGADLLYVSYARLPPGDPPDDLAVAPDLVVEVRSPTDRIASLTAKATDYLQAGVRVVLVLDPVTASAAVFRPDELPYRLHNGDEFTLPDILPGFTVPVKRFFE